MNANLLNIENLNAKIAGIAIVLMAIVAGVGYGYAFNGFFVSDDRFATIKHLQASKGLLKLTIGSFTVVLLIDVVVAWSLYAVFKRHSPLLSLLSTWLRLIYAVTLGIAITFLVSAMKYPLSTQQDSDFVFWMLNSFLNVWSFGLIIFGAHLMALAFVLFKSGLTSKIVSGLALFAGICYVMTNVLSITFSSYQPYKETVELSLGLPMALGELVLAVWLLLAFRNEK